MTPEERKEVLEEIENGGFVFANKNKTIVLNLSLEESFERSANLLYAIKTMLANKAKTHNIPAKAVKKILSEHVAYLILALVHDDEDAEEVKH